MVQNHYNLSWEMQDYINKYQTIYTQEALNLLVTEERY
jgi:hypothetical protein